MSSIIPSNCIICNSKIESSTASTHFSVRFCISRPQKCMDTQSIAISLKSFSRSRAILRSIFLSPMFPVVPRLLCLDLPIIAVEKLAVAKDSNSVFGDRYIRGYTLVLLLIAHHSPIVRQH